MSVESTARSAVSEELQSLLDDAVQRRVSDVHLEPDAEQFRLRLRIDGMLIDDPPLALEAGRRMVNRLMVMAGLLTYRRDIPQEGRLSVMIGQQLFEMRLAIMPTTHGLRAALRLPVSAEVPATLEALHLPAPADDLLRRFAAADQGMLLVTGPAGSGKTTTIYALLAHLADTQPHLGIVTLEDPVERDLSGVTQVQVNPFGELTYARALRSIVRQDPQVLMIGEVRDAETASIAVQAALSGHRLISTLHAGDPAEAVARLMEMRLEPYQITSALFGVISQRLLRRLDPQGGYAGRLPVAEATRANGLFRKAILDRADAADLRAALHDQPDYCTMTDAANDLIERGRTDAAEAARVLGESFLL